MHTPFRAGLTAAAAAVVVFSSSLLAGGNAGASTSSHAIARRACADAPTGYASCFALVRVDAAGRDFVSRVSPNFSPPGFHPVDLQQAYNLTSKIGKTGTIAIVDAYDNPNAEKDLGVYRKQFGLPPCTKANGCFKKVNQNGAASPLPPTDTGWGVEISLDLDMASAICPHCNLILVEASTNSFTNLGTAAKRAGMMSHIVSNSYGGNDFPSAGAFASYYTTAGVQQIVSSGDHNYNGNSASGPQIPAAFKSVVAVGGTSLTRATNARGWSEKVWFTNASEGTGSGCSVSTAKPAWQTDPKCKKRTIADTSAVADPATGVSVYDSFGLSGWSVFGGTSASAPIIAGVIALAGNAASLPVGAKHIYANASHLNDVTVGSNGTCAGSYLCTAKPGYDGPTGLGTPNGVGAF